MNFIDRLRLVLGSKESQARVVTTMSQIGKPQNTPANYEGFAKFGFSKNLIVYSAINKIATSCGGIEWNLYSKGKGRKADLTEVTDSPLLTLLDRPNPLQAKASFFEAVVAYRMITGNSYIEANAPQGIVPLELWPVRPDKMKVVPGLNGYPAKYVFEYGGVSRSWDVNPLTLQSLIMQWKSFNPLNDWYGLSPLEASMLSLDQNNAGQKWNLAMLQNSATPSGVLQMKVTDVNPRGELTDEQYKRIKGEFETSYQGARNAGKPILIEGGLNWQTVSLSPKDMDWLKGREVTAIDILIALGVPPEIMGLGQKTFANYAEARLAFYEETILPTMDSLRDSLNAWLTPAFGESLYLDYDRDDIEALMVRRMNLFTSLAPVKFLTVNEKRTATGYEDIDGGDDLDTGAAPTAVPDGADTATDKPAADDLGAADATGDVRKETLNGAQIQAIAAIVSQVAAGTLPRDSALSIIMLAFNLDEAAAEAIMGSAGEGFTIDTDEADDVSADPTKPKKPTKKPVPDEDPDKSFGWKSLNLLNKNEKQQSWRKQNARRAQIEVAFKRDVKADYVKLANELHAAAEKLGQKDPKVIEYGLNKTATDWSRETLAPTMKRNIKYALEDFGGAVLGESKSIGLGIESKANLKFDHFVTEYTNRHTAKQISTINSTNEKTIRRIVSMYVDHAYTEGESDFDLAKSLQDKFTDLSDSSATRIARTETGMASNNGSLEAVKSLGAPNMFKEWVAADDDRVRDGDHGGADHTAVSGDEIPLDAKFHVPPDADMDGPGDPAGDADQVINCRCVLVYRSKNKNGD